MPVSKPMRTVLYTLRLTEEERERLKELAAERDVTVSYAMREGARLLLEDAKVARDRVAAT